jgi:SAM-dependent methyltransferase
LSIGKDKVNSAAGCDFSSGMLSECKGIDARLQTSPTELPFESASFDFVTAVCVYHHVPLNDRLPLTREVDRLLKPGGIFCIIEHNPLNPVTQLIVSQLPVDRDAILLTAGTARKIQRSIDLRIEQTVNFLYFPEAIYVKIGGLENWLTSVPFGGQYAVFGRKAL